VDIIAFEIMEKNLKTQKTRHRIIYFNGRVKGFYGACVIKNYALPVWLKMQTLEGELKREKEYSKHLEERLGICKT